MYCTAPYTAQYKGVLYAGVALKKKKNTHPDVLPLPVTTPTGFILDPHLPHLRHALVRALALVEFEHDLGRGCFAATTLALPEDGEEDEGCEKRDEYDEEAKQERRRGWGARVGGGGGGARAAGGR